MKDRLPAKLPERIENLGATFNLDARLHKWSEPRCQFTIKGPEFEKKTGVRIEEMRDYVIKGRIEGVGDFQKTLRRCSFGQNIPIYVPTELHSKIESGRTYQVTIDTIEKLPPRRMICDREKTVDDMKWSWREVASWIDTEGTISSDFKSGGRFGAYIAQKEKSTLEGLGKFLESEGFHVSLILNRDDGVYHLHVIGAEQTARLIKNIEPFIRTTRRKEQIAVFKEALNKPKEAASTRDKKRQKDTGTWR